MEQMPATPQVRIESGQNNDYKVSVVRNLAEHELVIGPNYEQKDIKILTVRSMGRNTSGILSE